MTSRRGGDTRARLVTIAVHDLRNPLASILGNAEYLTQARELHADTREAAADLLAGAKLFARILAELRAVNRGLDGQIEVSRGPVDVAALAAQAIDAAAAQARRGDVTLSLAAGGVAEAHVDRELLRHVLDDVLDDALRNAPPRTAVDMAVVAADGEVAIAVRDRRAAPTMPLEELFEIDGEGGTAGRRLALVFCRMACAAMGGRIEPRLPPDGGLVMTVRVPGPP